MDVYDDTSAIDGGRKIRRSVAIFEKNARALTRARGVFMQAEIDLSYVTALNIFLELGLEKFLNRKLSDRDWQIVEHHILEAARREVHDDNLAEMNLVRVHKQLQSLRQFLSNAA